MALTDFFRINLPYGIKCNDNNEWAAFNREYMPLGSNNKSMDDVDAIYTKYKGLTEKSIQKIINDETRIHRNKEGKITMVFFYNDSTNPQSTPKYWKDYFKIIKHFSKCQIKTK